MAREENFAPPHVSDGQMYCHYIAKWRENE
jgi:hypothetical protein